MFPIFNTIEEGGRAAAGFVRRYRWMALGFFAAYFAAAAIGVSGIVRLPMPLWLASLLVTWGLGAVAMVAMAPIWTALYRFAVLGDATRQYRQFDTRTLRVAGVMAVMSVIMLLGAVPFALGLDILPRVGPRRLVVLGAVAFAFMVKLGSFWLNARLVIAPAMAAAGSRPQALDTSFVYTRWSSFKVLFTLLLVYFPLLSVSACFIAGNSILEMIPGSPQDLAFATLNVVLTTALSATTDLVWGGVCGRMALKLVKAHRAKAAEATRRAKERRDEDD